jgi:choice-of-anchor A domain-containing protein
MYKILLAAVSLALSVAAPQARAVSIPLGAAASYAVLYTGEGGNTLKISGGDIVGNVGVAGTGWDTPTGTITQTGKVLHADGSMIAGQLDFAAAQSSPDQYIDKQSSGNWAGPALPSPNYNVFGVTTALKAVAALSTSLAGVGNNLAINGPQIVDASAGLLQTINNVVYRIFNVTSYTFKDGEVLTINGDGGGNPVVFNFGNYDVALKGLVNLVGLTPDQVLFNFTGTNNVSLNTKASTYADKAFQGTIIAMDSKITLDNANLVGHVYGGDNDDFEIKGGSSINMIPEPSSIVLLGLGLAGLTAMRRRRQGR